MASENKKDSPLASQSERLAAELENLKACGHESTSADISDVARELDLLSVELRNLDEAVAANKSRYTQAFYLDLEEIKRHLEGIFEDIFDCCKELHKADGINGTAVAWLHKKRYVHKLQKHLEANKTTLVVMRTVLAHGKSYGTQNTPGRLAESNPHTMHEDRVILEAIFASKSAISDLRKYGEKKHGHTSSNASSTASDATCLDPGAHGRKLSSATGVELPLPEDVLPIADADVKRKTKEQDALRRRFSRRRVRLAVHSTIVDAKDPDLPGSLGKRWLANRNRRSLDIGDRDMFSIAQLSKISEADTVPFPDICVNSEILPSGGCAEQREGQTQISDATEGVSHENITKAKLHGNKIMSTSVGKRLSKVIKRLATVERSEGQADGISNNQENKVSPVPNHAIKYLFRKPFLKPELTTPDFEADCENNTLR